jgi:hypothetical protein
MYRGLITTPPPDDMSGKLTTARDGVLQECKVVHPTFNEISHGFVHR